MQKGVFILALCVAMALVMNGLANHVPPTAQPHATSSAATATTTPTAEPTSSPAPTETPPPNTPTPQATATSSPSPTPALAAQTTITLTPFIDGLTRPVYLTHNGGGSLYVVEQAGRILAIQQTQGKAVLRQTPFLDITSRVGSSRNEQGLLSMAFSPNYARDNAFWVNYTDNDGHTVISRFVVNNANNAASASADPASEQIVLRIEQPYANHNGGQLKFGPDRMLYIGMGDGGSQGDPQGNGQNLQSKLGKLLRIDVLSQNANQGANKGYVIPPNNPFASDKASAEVWAWGLRNPWRFSFDRQTGDLYIADVGQSNAEEIDFQPANSKGGENYGWNKREGFEAYRGGEDSDANGRAFTPPIHAYGRSDGCSVTGGYVYRGATIPALQGAYLFADYCSGKIWQLRRDRAGMWQNTLLLDTDLRISSFGEAPNGELYVLDLDGAIYTITSAQRSSGTPQLVAQRPRLVEFYADW